MENKPIKDKYYFSDTWGIVQFKGYSSCQSKHGLWKFLNLKSKVTPMFESKNIFPWSADGEDLKEVKGFKIETLKVLYGDT